MSNGDDEETADDAPEESAGDAIDPNDLETRLDDAGEDLEAAETEADLDEVEAELDDVESDLEAADLPEPEDEEEDDPGEALSDQLSDLRSGLEEQRGPYAEDVTAIIDDAAGTLRETRWTDSGEADALAAARAFGDEASEILDADVSFETDDPDAAADELDEAGAAIADADLDADTDGETIAELLEAAEQLRDGLAAAEEWDDLTIREQLDAQGFYDVLTPENRRDYPAEWNAIRIYEERREPEPILTALERFESDFMAENAMDALEHFAPEEAFDAMHERAQRRSVQPIRILGRIGDERACETLHDFLGGGDVTLEKTVLRALGAIGSEESTQPVADQLVADDPEIRSVAARSLGLLGDTRTVEPLQGVLENDDADEVRASAAWALNQIGTERALAAAAEYADDRSYIVQVEAEKATGV